VSPSRAVRVSSALLAAWIFAAAASLVVAPPTWAEDTCVAAAPFQPLDVVGLTWSGSVIQIRKIGFDDVGYERWIIVMAVDHVYAHLPGHDIPAGSVLAAGAQFELPSDNCGRKGDMGMRVGGRYLVSAAFVAATGTSLTNLIVWQIDGAGARIPQGLYQVPLDSTELASVASVDQALSVLGVQAQPTPSPRPSGVGPTASAGTRQPSAPPAASVSVSVVGLVGLAATIAALAAVVWRGQMRRREG
jgi:hypothetical protein